MNIIISHISALHFWRTQQAEPALAGKRLEAGRLPKASPGARRLRGANIFSLPGPLHVLVGSRGACWRIKEVVCHAGTGYYPPGSFIEATQDVAVSSPELCFVQMACVLPLPELIALGLELCGGYRLDKVSNPAMGFRKDIPLTGVNKLQRYIESAPGLHGRKKALRALQFVAAGSASPMETALDMLITLPYRLGGFNFAKPQLNHPVYVPDDELGGAEVRLVLDMLWLEKNVSVEYNSDAYHSSEEQIKRDEYRRLLLQKAGITEEPVGRTDVMYVEGFNKLVSRLAKLLGKRIRVADPEFKSRHSELRRIVLPRLPDRGVPASALRDTYTGQ